MRISAAKRAHCSRTRSARLGSSDRRARGFSLIEMTIAIAIVASLTALAAMHLAPANEKLRVEAEVREIASVLSEVRTRALTTGVPGSIIIDAVRNRLVYGTPALERLLPESLALDVAPDGDGRREQRIVFYPEGGASGGAFVLSGRTHRVLISVDWLTGRITLGAGDAS